MTEAAPQVPPADAGANASPEVEVLFFQLDGERLGADASQVLRIERPGVSGARRSRLRSASPRRALVFQDGGGAEGALEVDLVLGVRAVSGRDLRRVPGAARVADYAIGFWLDGERPVLLIDLPRTLAAPAPAPAPTTDQPSQPRMAT